GEAGTPAGTRLDAGDSARGAGLDVKSGGANPDHVHVGEDRLGNRALRRIAGGDYVDIIPGLDVAGHAHLLPARQREGDETFRDRQEGRLLTRDEVRRVDDDVVGERLALPDVGHRHQADDVLDVRESASRHEVGRKLHYLEL